MHSRRPLMHSVKDGEAHKDTTMANNRKQEEDRLAWERDCKQDCTTNEEKTQKEMERVYQSAQGERMQKNR